jgi:HAD superfamily hydrolase (TIGR01450 family)
MQSNSTNCKRVKVPALLCDIDGVLTRGRLCLPRSADAVRLLKRPLSELNPAKFSGIDSVVPFILVTNGGGNLEKNHAKLVNGKMGLEN